MLKIVTFILFCGLLYYVTVSGNMLGDGMWTVLNVQHCEDPDQYEMKFNCARKKMNRTHDCFNADFDLKKEINDEDYAIEIKVFREVDGGFKLYQQLSDNSFCNFSRKYAKDNMEKILRLGGIDPPDCPIKPGRYELKGYIFDYTELPEICIYGLYKVYAYMMQDGEKISCICLLVECKKIDDFEDDYED